MPEVNKANRQVCDVDIRVLSTIIPFLFFDTANTTTAGLSGDSAYAMAKGSRRISFANPLEGSMSVTAQVYPFRLFALLSDGTIESNASYAEHKVVTCKTEGELPLAVENGSVVDNKVFAYPNGSFGEESACITAEVSGNKVSLRPRKALESFLCPLSARSICNPAILMIS